MVDTRLGGREVYTCMVWTGGGGRGGGVGDCVHVGEGWLVVRVGRVGEK